MAGFSEIIGHEQIIEHLQNAIRLNKVSHAYIPVSYTHLREALTGKHPGGFGGSMPAGRSLLWKTGRRSRSVV